MAKRDLAGEIREALSAAGGADPPIAGARDVAARLIDDASIGPGEYVRLVARATPARAPLPPTLAAALSGLRARRDRSMGSVSKALAYSHAVCDGGRREHADLIRLIKGGFVRVCEVSGAPPAGSVAHRDAPYSDRYYVLHAGPCEGEG